MEKTFAAPILKDDRGQLDILQRPQMRDHRHEGHIGEVLLEQMFPLKGKVMCGHDIHKKIKGQGSTRY